MKTLTALFLFSCNIVLGQQHIAITTDKTTALIFPFAIKHVDRGTKDVLVQPVKENEKILLVKAAVRQFGETNLSVVTGDGNVYSFTVDYNAKPESFVYELPVNSKVSISTYANSILDNRPIVKGVKNKSWDMHGSIIGIYIKDDVIYYQLLLRNHSPIDYDIAQLRFFIRDKKKGKRTAVQENDCAPLYVAGNDKQVKAYNFCVLVFALQKFTIPDAKFLRVQITEKNGGRHLHLKITNSKIIKAVVLPDLH